MNIVLNYNGEGMIVHKLNISHNFSAESLGVYYINLCIFYAMKYCRSPYRTPWLWTLRKVTTALN